MEGILAKELDITWGGECRCDYFNARMLNDETLALCRRSGLVQLTSGIELPQEIRRPEYRLTVDYPEDLEVVRRIYQAPPRREPLPLTEVYSWLDDNPETALLNRNVTIKGCDLYAAKLTRTGLYSIVRSGAGRAILDGERRPVDPAEFQEVLVRLFPELRRPD